MTFRVEVVLRDTNHAVTETVDHAGNDASDWTEGDVDRVLRTILLAIHHAKYPEDGAEPTVTLRGMSWIVNPFDEGVVIAVEVPSGAAVAGPFDIPLERLDGMVGGSSGIDVRTGARHPLN